MIVKPDGYFLETGEFGCLILEELKGGLPSYRVIRKGLMRSSEG